MAKKKLRQNEFYFFMLDKKNEVELRVGRTVSMAELPGLLDQEWKSIPEDKKAKYKKMKMQNRERNEKLDCRGVPLREILKKEQERKLRESQMREEIALTIESVKQNNVLEKSKFFLVCITEYVATEEMQHVPAEVAILLFSLQNGIMDEYHAILPPKIPLGYAHEAQIHSDKTHNLIDENNKAVTDKKLGHNIIDFIVESGKIEEGVKLPPLYTLEEQMDQTIKICKDLIQTEVDIYCLDELFQHMYAAVFSDNPIPKVISHDMLTHCGLDFHPTIACEWHIQYQSDAGKYCALGCVRRWVFHICDNLNLEQKLGIEVEEGKHLPREQTNTGTVVDIPRLSTSRDVSLASSTQDVFSFSKCKKAIYEIKTAPGPVASARPTRGCGKNLTRYRRRALDF